MDSALWLAVLAAGLIVAVLAGRSAIDHMVEFAVSANVPPLLIGMTLVAIGTDLPEIANSVVASFAGHGDINVGDSVGSAIVQSTLVLGILPLLSGSFPIRSATVWRLGLSTAIALVAGAALMRDGDLTRGDAIVLIAAWFFATAIIWRTTGRDRSDEPTQAADGRRWAHLVWAGGGLALVGLGATAAVEAMTQLAELWAIPEFLVAFLLVSVGTSLPELTVGITAVRRGQWDLAVGDALGASLLDATVSIAAGPLFFPVAVTTVAAVTGSLTAAGAALSVTVLLAIRGRHDRVTGLLLLACFAASYLIVASLL